MHNSSKLPFKVIGSLKRLLKNQLYLNSHNSFVFVCGADAQLRDTGRYQFLKYAQKHIKELKFFLAEDVFKEMENPNIDLLTIEKYLADYADCILIVLESDGAKVELGAFALNEKLAEKILVVNNKVQYALLNVFLNKINVHDIAIAYRRGIRSPIKNELSQHVKYPYTLRVDMSDFFPSIKPDDLLSFIKSNNLTNNDEKFLIDSTFVTHKGRTFLGIGAPSSPQICNIVMYNIDSDCQSFAVSNKARVCRYADDIIFSANEKQVGIDFIKYLEELLEKTNSPKLHIKKDKTRLMFKGSQRKVLGLIITPEKKLSIGRKKKREIKNLIYKYTSLRLDEKKSLKGHLHYIADVEPSFLHSLNMKYGASAISRIMNER